MFPAIGAYFSRFFRRSELVFEVMLVIGVSGLGTAFAGILAAGTSPAQFSKCVANLFRQVSSLSLLPLALGERPDLYLSS